jgi:hypothetical protein
MAAPQHGHGLDFWKPAANLQSVSKRTRKLCDHQFFSLDAFLPSQLNGK